MITRLLPVKTVIMSVSRSLTQKKQPLHTANIYGKAAATAATATKAKWNEITRTSSIFAVYFSSDSSPFLLENMHEFTSLCFSIVVYSVYNVYNCFGFWYRSPNAYLPEQQLLIQLWPKLT